MKYLVIFLLCLCISLNAALKDSSYEGISYNEDVTRMINLDNPNSIVEITTDIKFKPKTLESKSNKYYYVVLK